VWTVKRFTLLFSPTKQWQNSTTYKVTVCVRVDSTYIFKVPAGAISIFKQSLDHDVIFEFTTPTLSITDWYPHTITQVSTVPLLAVFFKYAICTMSLFYQPIGGPS
jgi:hypothetical protein